jgi:hypothetical protein
MFTSKLLAYTTHASISSNKKKKIEGKKDYLDPECLMLLGLLYCADPNKLKAGIFYSMLGSKERVEDKSPKLSAAGSHSAVES